MVWDEWAPVAMQEHLKKREKWDKAETARLRRVAEAARTNRAPEKKDKQPLPNPPPLRMHPDDPDIFLKLSAALKLIMARSIDTENLPRAQQLLQDYLHGFSRVRFEPFDRLVGSCTRADSQRPVEA